MNIAICTLGSRGDVAPYLILAKGLSQQGHTVKFATAQLYESLVAPYPVEFTPFAGDYAVLVDNDQLKKAVGSNPFTAQKVLREKAYPVIESALDTFYEVTQWADKVVYHPKTLIDAFGHRFSEKLIKAYVVPAFTPTRAFPSPVVSGLPIPTFLNRASFKITNALISTVKTPVRNFYKKHGWTGKFRLVNTPVLYGVSEFLIKKPADYPPHHYFTGFWFDDNSSEQLDEHLISFFDTPRKKLIITFGSMPYTAKVPINELIQAIQSAEDLRVLLVRGWGLKDAIVKESENVMVIDQAPFDRLFPQADAVVHHGGAGTTAMALRAGLPMMICPILYPLGDQQFWGQRVHKAGLGVKPIPLKKLTTRRFTQSISDLLRRDFSPATQRMKEQLANEQGVENAVRIIEGMSN